jgi:hypothetical protein
MGFLKWLGSLLTGGALDRVLATVDKRIETEASRDRIKADLLAEYMHTRGDFMRAGGFILMLLFAVPLAVWFSAVVVYSIFWCAGCAFPQEWTIAALPAPLDDWAGAIIVSIFGVVGLDRFRR